MLRRNFLQSVPFLSAIPFLNIKEKENPDNLPVLEFENRNVKNIQNLLGLSKPVKTFEEFKVWKLGCLSKVDIERLSSDMVYDYSDVVLNREFLNHSAFYDIDKILKCYSNELIWTYYGTEMIQFRGEVFLSLSVSHKTVVWYIRPAKDYIFSTNRSSGSCRT